MPIEAFEGSFGWEWFVRLGVEASGTFDDDLFA
jgi:hypothetical protein